MNMWYVINHYPKLNDITEFESLSDAQIFYEKNCVNEEKTNCWGVLIQRPKGFFTKGEKDLL